MRAVVVIPTYNEAETIERTVAAVHAVAESVSNFRVELLVVDSSSPDGTAGIAQALQARFTRLHVLVEPRKSGLGGAYLYGMRHAVDALGADVLFEFDADLSHDPAMIPAFLNRLEAGDDFVVGTRYTRGGSIPASWAPHRRFLSVVGNRVIRFALGHRGISDWTGGYRAFSRRHFERLEAELRPYTGYTFQTAFLHKAVQGGARVSEVPYRFADRSAGASKFESREIRAILAYLLHHLLAGLAQRLEPGRAGRMALVGLLGMLIHGLVLRLLVEVGQLGPVLANLLAAQVAIASNFALNERWTFADRRLGLHRRAGRWGRYLQFAAGSLLGVSVIQTGAIWLGLYLFGPARYMLFWLLGTGLLFIWNYTVSNRLVWRAQAASGL